MCAIIELNGWLKVVSSRQRLSGGPRQIWSAELDGHSAMMARQSPQQKRFISPARRPWVTVNPSR